MDQPDDKELQRRAKISQARKGRAIAGDGGVAARAARSSKADEFAHSLMPVLKKIAEKVTSFHGIAAELNRRDIKAPRGGPWNAKQVERIWQRISE